MKIHKAIRDILFLCIVVYFSQGALYTQGTIISQSLLAAILGISSYYLFTTLLLTRNNKNVFYICWTIFLFMNIIGFIVSGNFFNTHHISVLKAVLLNFTIFYPLYFFSQNDLIKSDYLVKFFVVTLVIVILQFNYHENQILLGRVNPNYNIVNNIAYSFVWLIPFVFLVKSNILLRVVIIGVIIFFIIQSAKRGALITALVGISVIVYCQIRSIDRNNKLVKQFLVGISIIALLSFVYYTYTNNLYLVDRMDEITEGGGSGRDVIFMSIINYWSMSDSYVNILFGFGFVASRPISGNYAHNDWLELLSSFGLIGVIVYAFLFYAAFRYLYIGTWSFEKRMLMLSIVLMWFLITLYSMGYSNVTNGYLRTIILAYLVGFKIDHIR